MKVVITTLTFLALVSVSLVHGHILNVQNNCPYTIWVGTQGNTLQSGEVKPALENGGFQLDSKRNRILMAPTKWEGRVWGRLGCDFNNNQVCDTGDCGRKLECRGSSGEGSATLAEITFDGDAGKDFYDLSFVDGFNLPVSFAPTPGTVGPKDPNDKYSCAKCACAKDLIPNCPDKLKLNRSGKTVACLAACKAIKENNDKYCCAGEYQHVSKCKSSLWEVDYPKYFKDACPDAYSWAYDDNKSTFTCKGLIPGSSGYDIIFCP